MTPRLLSGLGARAAVRGGLALATVAALALALPGPVAAADAAPLPPLTPWSFVLDWQFDPTVWLPAAAAIALWWLGVHRAAAMQRRVGRLRTLAWVLGVGVVVVALQSGIGVYDDVLFSVHMVQHLLLIMIAPPLLLLAGPVTLLLQAVSSETRRGWVLPMLHARILGVIAHPVVAGVLFALVIWVSHVSPVYEAALVNAVVHDAEHAVYLGSALLFWWPVIGRDPSPWRLGPAVSAIYLALQMPQMAFLSVAILMAPAPLYPAYADAVRTWGPTPLADQQLAGGIMWVGASLVILGTDLVLIWRWMREEDRNAVREDRRLDREAALQAGAADGGATVGVSAAAETRAGLLTPPQPSAGTDAARYSR